MPSTDWPSPLTPTPTSCWSDTGPEPRTPRCPWWWWSGPGWRGRPGPRSWRSWSWLRRVVCNNGCEVWGGGGFGLHLISATFDPPLPMMQPMSSLGTVISWVCCWAAWFRAWPVRRARAETDMVRFRNFLQTQPSHVVTPPSSHPPPETSRYGKFHTFPPPLHSLKYSVVYLVRVTREFYRKSDNSSSDLARCQFLPHITCWIDHSIRERIDSVDNIDRQPNLSELKHY